MKLIIAIIQPSKLEDVKAALTDVEVFRLTVMDCQGFGRQKGQTEVYRGREFTVSAIIKAARSGDSGEIGDGKIFVLPMDECVRIRTGERGSDAI